MTSFFPRELTPAIQDALNSLPVVVVSGMRQVGKSTLLSKDPAFRERRYISLDDFAHLEAAKRNPEAFVRTENPLTLDEAQRCPELLAAIKLEVDRRRRPGLFLLSGSANFTLLRGITESLAGRAVYLALHPFTRREIGERTGTKPFLMDFFKSPSIPKTSGSSSIRPEEILAGGMPTVCLRQVKNPAIWFRGYEQTYLERDIRDLSQVAHLLSFRNLLHLAALRTGQILNISELARDAKLNANTTNRYMGLLDASFVIQQLAPYLGNKTSRLIKSPKLYLSDSGVACHLAGIQGSVSLDEDPHLGPLLETYAAQNLSGILSARWPEARLFFWNVQGRHEVDFVIEAGPDTLAIEIKGGSRWNDRDLAGLNAFLAKTPRCRAAILAYNGTETVQLADRLWAIPLSLILS